jgi:uncharacterized protein (TIGR02391 family)
MVQLVELIPDPDFVIALEPQELGLRMLPVLATWPKFQELQLEVLLNHLIGNSRDPTRSGQYPQDRRIEIADAVSEAWAWLENATLLIEHPPYAPSQPSSRLLSRRAKQLAKEPDPRRAFSTRRIPKDALHPAIREDVWADYHRGKYDTAVFEAMKAVEVAVREASGLAVRDIGTALMRKAFDPEVGPLTDLSDEKAEREARSALFAGAIGSYKNPQSHQKVALDDPDETAEIVMLANHLLRIVDERKKANARP